MASEKKTQILILGGGFGGLYAALRLDRTLAKNSDCQVTLVSKTNFTLFTPMLHEVAASDLDPSDIVNPIRKMLKHVTFYEADVRGIDLKSKQVTIKYGLRHHERKLSYDHVVIALGSETTFFDEQTRKNAVAMKTLGDAMLLRNRMIGLLESASVEENSDVRRRLLTFVVAGGGFAGVETIGAMNDFLRDAMKSYPQLDAKLLRVVLVHPGKVVLPEFSESLGQYAMDRLREEGIDVRLNTKVKSYDGQSVELDPGDAIITGTVIWTAGVAPAPLIQSLPLKKEKGRIVVNGCMQSEESPGVWALGDSAAIPDPYNDGKPYPATAQHAIRQGTHLAKNIEAAVLGGGRTQKPFKYKMMGQLAAIGQRRGAANIFGWNFSGFFAWFLWRSAYLSKLPRLEKKLRVAFGWTIDLFFSRDLVQLLTVDDLKRITEFGIRNNLTSNDHEPAPDQAKQSIT
jgi:NADH:ubiquinone reductase (H+-translocating)